MSRLHPKPLMVSDLLICDRQVLRQALRQKSKSSKRMNVVTCFILVFCGCMLIFSSYENIRTEDEYAREKRLGRGKSSSMVVSVMHVDYGLLKTKAESVLLPSQPDLSIGASLQTCCGIWHPDIVRNATDEFQDMETNCIPTTQIKVEFTSPFWTIQALDQNGKEKRTGGDEFFVSYSSTLTGRLVAKVIDQQDGTYDLDFFEPPLARSSTRRHLDDAITIIPKDDEGSLLTVHLLYTCGMGEVGPPLKKAWISSGALLKQYTFDDLNDLNVAGKSISIVPPSLIRSPWALEGDILVENGHRQLETTSKPMGAPPARNHVVFFGDNNLQAMGGEAAEVARFAVDCPIATPCPIVQVGNPSTKIPFSVNSLPQITLLLEEWHGELLRSPEQTGVTTLVLGFSSFDDSVAETPPPSPTGLHPSTEMDRFLPLSWDQVDHLLACESLIRRMREAYPRIHLRWRLPVPVPLHRLPSECHARNAPVYSDCGAHGLYLSYYRMQQLHQAQKQLMEELQVPVYDWFDAHHVSDDEYIVGEGVYSPRLHQRFVREVFESVR